MTTNAVPLQPPPHSIEAEQSLLGALLLDNQAFDRVADLVTGEDFYRDDHRRIWRHVVRLIEAGKPADLVTVSDSIEASEDKDKTGGPAYLGALAQNTPSALHIRRYAELVRDKRILRQLAKAASDVMQKALSSSVDPKELAEEAGAAFLGIEVDQKPAEMVDFGAAVVEAVEWEDNPAKGLRTGFPDVDKMLPHGLMPGDFIIIAGRPSMGKTAFAINIGEHVAARAPVAVFSLEMTRRKIAGRALRYHESLLGRDGAVDHLSALTLHIDDTAAIGLGYMRLRLRRLQRKHGLALAVVDYLQLMQAQGAENRTQEVSQLSRGLKALAKEFCIPVVAVAQLNRAVEGRADNRPVLSDLRESGQIEQDADVIAFVYRDEYYHPDTALRGIAEVLVRKNRDGATGTAHLRFIPEHTRFKPLDGPLPVAAIAEPKRTVQNFQDFKSRAAGE
jgi:replicative DNA helicase